MSASQKFRKSYKVILDVVPTIDARGQVEYKTLVPYATLYLIPHQDVKNGRIVVPVSDVLPLYKRYPHALLYNQSQIDHDLRTIAFKLSGLTWLPGSKVLLKSTIARTDYHTPQLNWRFYYTFAKGKRVSRKTRKIIRQEVEAIGQGLLRRPLLDTLKDCLSGSLGRQVEQRLAIRIPQAEDYLKGGYTFEIHPEPGWTADLQSESLNITSLG